MSTTSAVTHLAQYRNRPGTWTRTTSELWCTPDPAPTCLSNLYYGGSCGDLFLVACAATVVVGPYRESSCVLPSPSFLLWATAQLGALRGIAGGGPARFRCSLSLSIRNTLTFVADWILSSSARVVARDGSSKLCPRSRHLWQRVITDLPPHLPAPVRRFCAAHKDEGMVDVVSRRCEEPECRRRPLYGHEGEKGRFCSYHKVRADSVRRAPRIVGMAVLPRREG